MSELLTMPEGGEQIPLYEPIALPFGEQDVEEAMRLYMEFLQLPDDIKRKFHYFDPARPRTSQSGYLNRVFEYEKPTGTDDKYVFHHTMELWQHQRENIPFNERPEIARQFIEAADELYFKLSQKVKEKFNEWQELYEVPWLVGVHFPDKKVKHHLRFLAYCRGNEAGELARGHYDKSVATVAVAESTGGLRVGVGPEDLTPIRRGNFEPVIFKGFGWHQIHEMLGKLSIGKAAWHDAAESEVAEPYSDEIMRWALIYFVNPARIYLESTNEQTHKPIRWRGVGKYAVPLNAQTSFLAA